MHAAAERKSISQPALTKSLKLIEADVGTELFVRTSKGLEPTEAGGTLYRYARAIDQEMRFAAMDVLRSKREVESRLRLGVGPAVAVSSLPRVLSSFHRTFPAVKVTVETGITPHLVDSLIRGDLDVVVTSRPREDLPDRFARLHLFRHQVVVFCREGHPLRNARDVTMEQLAAYGRIGFATDDLEFERQFGRLFGTPPPRTESTVQTTSLTVMLDLLKTTDHFAIVNEMVLPRAVREGVLPLKLADRLWHLDIDLMCKRTFVDSRPVTFIRTAWREHTSIQAATG